MQSLGRPHTIPIELVDPAISTSFMVINRRFHGKIVLFIEDGEPTGAERPSSKHSIPLSWCAVDVE